MLFAHVHIFDATENWGGLGWGGVGLMTFLAHEHIFDATEMMTFLAHEHIFDATEMMNQSNHASVRHSLRTLLVQMQKNSSSRCCSIAQKAWHNVSAECFAVVQK